MHVVMSVRLGNWNTFRSEKFASEDGLGPHLDAEIRSCPGESGMPAMPSRSVHSWVLEIGSESGALGSRFIVMV